MAFADSEELRKLDEAAMEMDDWELCDAPKKNEAG